MYKTCNDTISALLLKNTAILKETLEEINKQSNDRSFATYDLPVVQSVSAKPLLTTENISASDQINHMFSASGAIMWERLNDFQLRQFLMAELDKFTAERFTKERAALNIGK